MTAVIETGVEASFADLLAGVLRMEHVPVDSDFFNDLGADSLLMAQFCARVRKRSDLPAVSMKDVYANPTIRRLAVAVATAHPPIRRSAHPPSPTPTNAREFVLCGTLQALFYLGFSYLSVLAATQGYQLFVGASVGVERVVRLLLFGAVAFLVVCAIPIAAKWLLIGRWKPRQIRLWSLDYVRFWIVKTLIRSNPAPYLFVGSPLYGLYLRALGANIGPGSLILSRRIPVCTDLLSIGAGTVIRREVSFAGYRGQAGRIEIGPVTLGRHAYVGEMAVLDIDTRMGDGAQLGHSSALHSGQAVPAGERWHGSPAQRTDVSYLRVPPASVSSLRRAIAGTLTLLVILFIYVPLLEGGLDMLSVWVSSLETGLVIRALTLSSVLFFGLVLLGLLAIGIVPRLLSAFVEPDTVYPLYGFRYSVYRIIGGLSRMRFLPLLFGDSSYIVHFLRWLGWRLTPLVQTGSNFGSEVVTTNPFLTSVGTGTMIADGLNVFNDDVSSTSFRVCRAAIGPRNFVGNYVNFPAGAKTGENVLLGTKVMVPIEGKTYQGVGLLGSPPFEIPRSVERDSRFDHLRTGDALRRGLAAKNRFNLGTIGIFLTTRWLGVFLMVLIDLAALQSSHAFTGALLALSAVAAAIYYALVERCFESLGPPPPPICSIYDSRFWWVERVWKLHPINFLHLFDGTPFKSVLWRLIGVRFGKRVFDDGVFISEPTLTVIGDECALNQQSILQCDSQEDGTYKSGPMTIGSGCTIGVGAFVHYGVTMEDGAVLAADSFLMKGETVPRASRWGGNPAREM